MKSCIKKQTVSIIVPVFNTEKYLSGCIESVLKQTCPCWELVLIDDGSTDLSGKICDEYALKDERIKVLHQKNCGVSSARNNGLKIASGEWITFLDADDWLDKKTVEFIKENMDGLDILRFGAKEVYPTAEKIIHVQATCNHDVYLNRIIAHQEIVCVWSGVYSKQLFEFYSIQFDKSLRKGEDWKVLFLLVYNAKKIKVIDESLYFYNKTNESSCTSMLSYEKQFDSLKTFQFICNNVNYNIEGIKEALLQARVMLYHKVIAEIAILETSHMKKAFSLINDVKRMIGRLSLCDIWMGNQSFKGKIVDSFSLHFMTFPLFMLVYKAKYKL